MRILVGLAVLLAAILWGPWVVLGWLALIVVLAIVGEMGEG